MAMFSLVRGLVALGKSSSEMLFQDVRQTAEYHAICRRVLSLRGLLRRGATEPVREMRRAEARFITGDKALIVTKVSSDRVKTSSIRSELETFWYVLIASAPSIGYDWGPAACRRWNEDVF